MFNAGMSPLHVLYSGVVLLLLTINKKKKKTNRQGDFTGEHCAHIHCNHCGVDYNSIPLILF
jgi:hypothetical protein